MPRFFSGVIAQENVQTGDGRVIAPGALYWDEDALTSGLIPGEWSPSGNGHHEVVPVAVVTLIERRGDDIYAEGWLDDSEGTPGADVARIADVSDGNIGVSIVRDDIEIQVVDTSISAAEAEEMSDPTELLMGSAGEPDPGDDHMILYEFDGSLVERWLRARVRAFTFVDVPALIGCYVTLGGAVEAVDNATEGEAVAASAAEPECVPCLTAAIAERDAIPVAPPAAWFAAPDVDRLTPLTVSDTGRVFGHIAPWGQCHTGSVGQCVTTPRSQSGYANFRTGYVVTDSGERAPTGVLTLGGGHADMSLSFRGAVEHYDDVGSAMADVTVGEDQFGVWVAGALRPGITPEQVRALRGSSPSGDWRTIGGALELVAVHAVNVPGFPIAHVASGAPTALIAAGALTMARVARAERSGLMSALNAIEALSQRVVLLESDRRALSASARNQLAAVGREVARDRLAALA